MMVPPQPSLRPRSVRSRFCRSVLLALPAPTLFVLPIRDRGGARGRSISAALRRRGDAGDTGITVLGDGPHVAKQASRRQRGDRVRPGRRIAGLMRVKR